MKVLSLAALLMMFTGSANALVINSWITNEGISANYSLTVTDVGDNIDFSLTVDPWNAEALGLFIDLGDLDITTSTLITAITTAPTAGGTITVFDTDTTSNSCGAGCNLNGLNPILTVPDGEWEYVFRLGAQGYEEIQTFSWTIADWNGSGVADSDLDILLAGVRSQQLCDAGSLLPEGDCDGSDKSYSGGNGGNGIPEPSVMALFGLGLLGLGFSRRRKAQS